jgi:broad specificity phosphatase PhoE
MPSTVYLIRHATPDWTQKDATYHLPPGPPLCEEGISESKALGISLLNLRITQIYTSPLRRCLQTAELAGAEAGIPVEVVSGLTEWQPGETYESVASRMWPTIKTALALCIKEGPACLVTHGGPIAALLLRMGMDQEILASHRIYDNKNPLPPAGVWSATYQEENECWDIHRVPNNNNP